MPDFVAALSCMSIIGIGFVSEAGYRIMQIKVVQTMSQGTVPSDSSLWRILYPKINMVQYYAGTVIKDSEFLGMGPIHPVINIIVYLVLVGTVLVVVFNRREVE